MLKVNVIKFVKEEIDIVDIVVFYGVLGKINIIIFYGLYNIIYSELINNFKIYINCFMIYF